MEILFFLITQFLYKKYLIKMFNTKYSKYKWIEVDKMEFKREDFELMRSFEDKLFLGLRADFFDAEPEILLNVDNQTIAEEVIEKIVVAEPEQEPEPTKEELAEIAKQKAIDDLKAALKELEKPEIEE